MIQTWIKLFTGPNENTFQEAAMDPNASFGTAILWRTVSIIIAAALGYLSSIMGLNNAQAQFQQLLASQQDLPPEMHQLLNQLEVLMTPQGLGFATLAGILFSLIGFIILCVIYHLIARMFGGNGSLGTFSYLSAGVWSPVSILQGLLGLIPVLGACLGLFVWIYGLVLSYFAIKTNYKLGDGRAIIVLIMPVILLFALAICGSVALGFIAAGLQSQ